MPKEESNSNRKSKPLVVVTGCSGLIGSRLIAALKGDHTIVGLDIVEPESEPRGWSWLECDLTDDKSVDEALEQIREKFGADIASVVHLAAYYDFSGDPSPMYDKLTVEGTRRLIERLRSFDSVEQFVFSSSLLAMKPAEETEKELTEESPTQGDWDYPKSKLEAERVLEEHRGEIPVVIHRIAGVYDEGGHSLPITQHIRRIYERHLESIVFPGDPEKGQAFIHLDDLIDCFCKTIEKRDKLGGREVFLIAEPDVVSYEELQNLIGDLVHGKEWPTIRIPKAAAKAGAWVKDKLTREDAFIKPWMVDMADDHYPVEIQRAHSRLAWSPEHRLRDTLPDMIERLKEDPRAWYERNNLPLTRSMRRAQSGAGSRR